MSKHLDPTASKFAPTGRRQKDATHQTSSPATYLEARVLNLEEQHTNLQEDVGALKELCHGLCSTVDKLKKGGWPVHVGPFQDVGIAKAPHQDAKQFSLELKKLEKEVIGPVNGDSDKLKATGSIISKPNGSVPPNIMAPSTSGDSTTKKSIPPHMRGKRSEMGNGNGSQQQSVTMSDDWDTTTVNLNIHPKQFPIPAPTPPLSPKSVAQDESIKSISLGNKQVWKPHHITTLAPFSGQVPCVDVTFHPDFLANHLGGTPWSPGLRFVKGKGPCILKNRTYYQIDPENEPFLPQAPGEHGAKLTAFFNKAPEEEFCNLFDDDSNSYENVPMFVLVNGRYVYYGNYSQTRWSDKLDHDTMMTKVPDHVKNFWAEELSAPTREEWVTDELKKHFFRKPEYNGRLFASPDNETTVNSTEDAKLTEKMIRDVRKYVDELRQWEREASMKTAMIKKQFILDAFNASDMDEAPALRLWWEYLECVDWRKDFYELLVTLQAREGQKYA